MTTKDPETHWQNVYRSKGESDVSWYQESPEPSFELIKSCGIDQTDAIVDIGGGASRLVDALIADGYTNLSVLDLSSEALAVAKRRLGAIAGSVDWIASDVMQWAVPKLYDIWHDRAAFHFLNEQKSQADYVRQLEAALRSGGHAIIGTFAVDGPEKCSGLTVARQTTESLSNLLGGRFRLVHSRKHEHVTPWKSVQKFQFSVFRFF